MLKFLRKKHHRKPEHAFDKTLVIFRAPLYSHHKKSLLWYLIALIITILLVIYGLKTDGWTFSVAVLVFAGTYYLFQHASPKQVDVKISKVGVKIGNSVFSYGGIKYFWIVYEPPFMKKLYLRMVSRLHPDIFINLDNADISKLHTVLSAHLDEKKGMGEPFADTLVRLLRL